MVKGFLHASGAVGKVGVGVELTKVYVPIRGEFLRENGLGHLAGFAALRLGIGLEVRRGEALLKADRGSIRHIGLIVHPVGGDREINLGAFVLTGQGDLLPGADLAALRRNHHLG